NRVRRVTDAGAFSARLIGISPGLNEAQRGAALGANDLATAEARYSIERDIARKIIDEKKQAEAFNAAELDHELALQKVKEDGIIRLAELEKQRLEGFKGEVGSIFDAITSRQPGALPNLLRSQALGIGRTFTENAAAKYLYPSIQKMIPHASGA